MKSIILLILLIPSIFYSQKKSFSTEDSVKIQKDAESKRFHEKLKKSYKIECTSDSIKAVNDSKTQNKYYINIAAPYGDEFLPSLELKEILQKNNIIWGGTWMGSDLMGLYSEELCYYVEMTRITEEKFGKDFIDNLVKESVSKYVEKNPKKIFGKSEHLKWLYKNKNLDFWGDNLLNKEFFEKFIYPKNYDYSKQKYKSLTHVTLVLDKNGKVLKIKNLQHHFYNESNKAFIPYFEKEIKKFIRNTKFEPVKYRGFPVKSEITFGLFYK